MLTKKQQWKRTNTRLSPRRQVSQFLYEEDLALMQGLSRSQSDSSVICPRRNAFISTRYFTESDLTAEKATRDSTGPRVRFSNQLRVVLVPGRSQYISRGVSQDVWYTEDDYTNFKTTARAEIMEFMQRESGAGCDVKYAINELYQSIESQNDLYEAETSNPLPSLAPPPGTGLWQTPPRNQRFLKRLGSDDSVQSTGSVTSTGTVESPIDVITKSNLHPNHGYAPSSSHRTRADEPAAVPPVVHPLALMI